MLSVTPSLFSSMVSSFYQHLIILFHLTKNHFLQLLPYLLFPVTAKLGDVVLTLSISLPSSSNIPIINPLNLLLARSSMFPTPRPFNVLVWLLGMFWILFTPILLRFFPRLPNTTVCWDSSYLLPSQSQTPSFLLNPRQHPRTAVPYIWYTLLDGLINPHGSHYHSWPTHVSLFSPCELQMHVFILITHWMAQVLKLNMSVQSLTWSKWYFYTSCKISAFCTKPFNVYPPCSM